MSLTIPRIPFIMLIGAFFMLVSSCGDSESNEEIQNDALVSVGDSTLYLADVLARIPRGLAPEDSAEMFRNITDEWVRDLVLAEFARNNVPDIDRIEKMVDAYRANLIVSSYIQSMIERSQSDISEDRVKRYYQDNRESMVLEEPLIKGAFLKVSQNDQKLERLKGWMAEFSDASIDKIEEAGLRHASNYKYFKDQWQSWGSIAEQIPYRFFDADAFVKSTRNFETSDAGSVYLLHISDYLPSGSEMPYEYARLKIREILASVDFNIRRDKLISDIYEKQMKDGFLKAGIYDPVKHALVRQNN